MSPKKELLWSLWVGAASTDPTLGNLVGAQAQGQVAGGFGVSGL